MRLFILSSDLIGHEVMWSPKSCLVLLGGHCWVPQSSLAICCYSTNLFPCLLLGIMLRFLRAFLKSLSTKSALANEKFGCPSRFLRLAFFRSSKENINCFAFLLYSCQSNSPWGSVDGWWLKVSHTERSRKEAQGFVWEVIFSPFSHF